MKRIAIIGGGIAGVTAAYELSQLARNGPAMQVVCLKPPHGSAESSRPCVKVNFSIECGPDAWVTEKPWARELAEELGLGDEVMPSNDATRKTYVLIDKQLQAMPDGMRMMVPSDLDALDASDLFSAHANRPIHNEVARADELKAGAPAHDESVAEFVRPPLRR